MPGVILRVDDGAAFSPEAIAIFLVLYLGLAVLALGLAVPAGNFIPALTIGAALGRLEATLARRGDCLRVAVARASRPRPRQPRASAR